MSNNDAQIADSPNYRRAWNDLRRMWADHPLVQALSNKPGDKTERRAASMAILPEGDFHYLHLPPEKVKYTPPIVDDAGIDIYNRVPDKLKQEIRDNIWKYLEQVQRDYPPEPRAEGA